MEFAYNNGIVKKVLFAGRIIEEQNNEIKELKEAKIIMERAMKSQEEFIVNISHELKTPLNVIFSAAQLFEMYCNNGSLDEKKENIIKYIDSMKLNSYRLSKLINNIVDSSKINAGFFELKMSNNNIVEVIEDTVMSVINYTDSKWLNMIFDTDVEEEIIACDPEKIERVVLNLISNAIKFSEKGKEIFVNIKIRNKFVEISVKDSGVGLKTNQLERIFERFKQVNESLSRNVEGTGIGLSLVKSIVELHGGRMFVESEFGIGSKFIFTLPIIKVMQENLILPSKIRNKSDNILVELSDISL